MLPVRHTWFCSWALYSPQCSVPSKNSLSVRWWNSESEADTTASHWPKQTQWEASCQWPYTDRQTAAGLSLWHLLHARHCSRHCVTEFSFSVLSLRISFLWANPMDEETTIQTSSAAPLLYTAWKISRLTLRQPEVVWLGAVTGISRPCLCGHQWRCSYYYGKD